MKRVRSLAADRAEQQYCCWSRVWCAVVPAVTRFDDARPLNRITGLSRENRRACFERTPSGGVESQERPLRSHPPFTLEEEHLRVLDSLVNINRLADHDQEDISKALKPLVPSAFVVWSNLDNRYCSSVMGIFFFLRGEAVALTLVCFNVSATKKWTLLWTQSQCSVWFMCHVCNGSTSTGGACRGFVVCVGCRDIRAFALGVQTFLLLPSGSAR